MATEDDEVRLERELFVRALMPAMRGDGAARLAALLTPREVPAGTVLFREGDAPDQFFFVVQGQVVMEAEGLPPWTFGERSLVGIVDMNAGRPHRRTCKTTRPTRLLAGRSAAWLDLLDDDPVMGEGAIVNFARRLHTFTLELGDQLPPEPIAPDPPVTSPLQLHEKALALRDMPLLARASTQAIASLAQVSEELRFAPGEVLFELGHTERSLFGVVRGVVVLRSRAGQVTRIGPLRMLAPAAALAGELGEYSAHAESAAIVLRVREEEYYDQSDEHPDLTRAAIAYMSTESEKMMNVKPPMD